MVYTEHRGPVFLLSLKPPHQPPQPIPLFGQPNLEFRAWSWSPDGNRLGGWLLQSETADAGIGAYSLAGHRFERLTDFGAQPLWMNDNRRLLFVYWSKLYVVDSLTRKVHEILSVGQNFIWGFSITPDNRTLYYNLVSSEGDIWLARSEETPQSR